MKKKTTSVPVHNHESDYSDLLNAVRTSFIMSTKNETHLFKSDVEGLNDLYLDRLPTERQIHNCHTCKKFIETYGGLVIVTKQGDIIPVMWDPFTTPSFYFKSFKAMREKVKKARIVSPFYTKESVWGLPKTGTWVHIAVDAPNSFVYRERALTAKQAMSAAKENFKTVAQALIELTAPKLDEALRLFNAEVLVRSEKFVAPIRWLRGLHDRPKGRLGENILWKAIASAPEGYCHPKASVIGPLLDDITAGLSFEVIKRKWDNMLNPIIYQRPQADPSTGNIKQAEELVAKLGIAPSLERRFATLDDCQGHFAWLPKLFDKETKTDSVFGHLKAKNAKGTITPVDLPIQTITWDKFQRTILPTAEEIELLAPIEGRYIALTTAVNPDAPVIFKWGNHVAWYLHSPTGYASDWNLKINDWVKVTAIVPNPTMWGPHVSPFIAEGFILILEGAVDKANNKGNALFPECLNSELYSVRSTIEAYSHSAKVLNPEQASACGYNIRKTAEGAHAECKLRVLTNKVVNEYHIDRWD
jgi:hypothetical protein